jgi:hypothetical protein
MLRGVQRAARPFGWLVYMASDIYQPVKKNSYRLSRGLEKSIGISETRIAREKNKRTVLFFSGQWVYILMI